MSHRADYNQTWRASRRMVPRVGSGSFGATPSFYMWPDLYPVRFLLFPFIAHGPALAGFLYSFANDPFL